jgi:predicted amidohydrolase YtcJ
VAKILLSMQDLQMRALAEIHKQPGCSTVRKIAINRIADACTENNWSMCVLSAGDADANTAARAAREVQRALRHDYNLATD